MKDIFKDGVQNIKDIKLTDREKSLVFSKISAHMSSASSTPTSLNWFVFFHKTSVVIAVLVFIFSGAAVVVASEDSLPGDFLYPIKVSVKEPIISAVSLSQSAKIKAEASKASERLKEAEQLSQTGRLTTDARKEIEDRFEKHVDKMDSIVEVDSRKEDDKKQKKVKVQNDFEDSVIKHTEELEKIKEELPEEKKIEVEMFKNNVLKTVQDKKDKNRKDKSRDVSENRNDDRANRRDAENKRD